MKKHFLFHAGNEPVTPAASAAALQQTAWPGISLSQVHVLFGHSFTCSSPSAGKSMYFVDVLKAALRTEKAGGRYAQ
ncbi:hypothetical protein ACYDMD_20200 [Pantoea agglomerans]